MMNSVKDGNVIFLFVGSHGIVNGYY